MVDLNQCPCAGINLDRLIQPTILLFLAEQELHGYGLIQKIMGSPMLNGEKPDPTGVYRSLKILENRGLVISSWELVESGAPKKIYKITAEGITCLSKWTGTLAEYRLAIEALIDRIEGLFRSNDLSARSETQDKSPGPRSKTQERADQRGTQS